MYSSNVIYTAFFGGCIATIPLNYCDPALSPAVPEIMRTDKPLILLILKFTKTPNTICTSKRY